MDRELFSILVTYGSILLLLLVWCLLVWASSRDDED